MNLHKNFNPKHIKRADLAYLEAKLIDRALGYTSRYVGVSSTQRSVDAATCQRAVGPAVVLSPGKAHGAAERRKGGVIPGMRVF